MTTVILPSPQETTSLLVQSNAGGRQRISNKGIIAKGALYPDLLNERLGSGSPNRFLSKSIYYILSGNLSYLAINPRTTVGITSSVYTEPMELSSILTSALQWSPEQIVDTRLRLRTFEEDWNAPGMEGYDDL